ncbi:unnamed protein product, partial [marine sediment metagenome]
MYILGQTWRDGYLDYHLHEGGVRIAVKVWWQLERVLSIFDDQPRSMRRLWYYWREVGLRALIRKVRSRLGERLRDRRVVALGVGQVLQTRGRTPCREGEPVCFLAPCHPDGVERVVLPGELVSPMSPGLFQRLTSH